MMESHSGFQKNVQKLASKAIGKHLCHSHMSASQQNFIYSSEKCAGLHTIQKLPIASNLEALTPAYLKNCAKTSIRHIKFFYSTLLYAHCRKETFQLRL